MGPVRGCGLDELQGAPFDIVINATAGGYTLRRNESVKTMDPAASDVWAAGHILLWLVGVPIPIIILIALFVR